VYTDQLAGAYKKHERACRLIATFDDDLSTFLRENPIRVAHEAGTKQAKFVRSVFLPPDLLCTLGDALHNLRSALDHLAYSVAIHIGLTGADAESIVYHSLEQNGL
jgi:hypothetical protein